MASLSQTFTNLESSPVLIISPAESIAGNDDLVAEILRRLPVKSLMRFKSVCKSWHSLISDHHFSLLWQHHQKSVSRVSGLFLSLDYQPGSEIAYIPLVNGSGNPHDSLSQFPKFGNCGDIVITKTLSSCNGLFLCCTVGLFDDHPKCKSKYHIYNPTIKQFKTLPRVCDTDYIDGMSLAFDSSKSPFYKVVTLQRRKDQFYQIHTYSSEFSDWRLSGEPFQAPFDVNFQNGVFWNGAINWLCYKSRSLLCFDVDQDQLHTMPSLSVQSQNKRVYRHFGECKGHLHLIEFSGYFNLKIDVFEMERDYSKWYLKYCVDLSYVDRAFQELMVYNINATNNLAFSVLSLIREELDEDSFLVLYVGGNIISFNLKDETSEKICGVGRHSGILSGLQRFGHLYVHQYMETLFHVG